MLVTAPHIDCPDAIAFLADHGNSLFLVFLQAPDPVGEGLGVVGDRSVSRPGFQGAGRPFRGPPARDGESRRRERLANTDGWGGKKTVDKGHVSKGGKRGTQSRQQASIDI